MLDPKTRAHAARAARAACLAMLAAAAVVTSSQATVYLNEIVIRGVERVELYNSDPDSVDLSGWRIAGSSGEILLPAGTTIAGEGYLVIDDLGGILDEIGGEVSVIDDVGGQNDRVQYGDQGGAPLPHENPQVSLARAPDASAGPPTDPLDDAVWWTLDLTATFGAPNNAPEPDLGSSLVLNELQPFAPPGALRRDPGDKIEIHNPTPLPLFAVGWFVTLGSGVFFNPSTLEIPPFGFQVWDLPAGLEIEDTGLVYLFDADSVRVDQLGLAGILPPGLTEPACVGRCPDGAGPNDGFDFETSGGGDSLIGLTCTLGESNSEAEECGGPVPSEPASWGRIKTRFRQ